MRIISQTSKNSKRTLEFILLLFFVVFSTVTISSQMITESGFENTNEWDGSPWNPEAINISLYNDAREGKTSARFRLSSDRRSEMVLQAPLRVLWGTEYWIGFSVKILEQVKGFNIFFQHHGAGFGVSGYEPPAGSGRCWGASNGLTLKTLNNERLGIYTVKPESADRVRPNNARSATSLTNQKIVDFEHNKWHDIVIHFKYAYDNTGFMEIWVDGKNNKVINHHNQANFHRYGFCENVDQLLVPPFANQKIGMYYGHNTVDSNGNITVLRRGGEILYDAFRIGKGSSVKYEDVAPKGSTLATAEFQNTVDVTISPNPTATEINIQFPEAIKVENVSIYDVLGREVFTKSINLSKNMISITPHLTKGIYMLKIASEKGALSKKVIIN